MTHPKNWTKTQLAHASPISSAILIRNLNNLRPTALILSCQSKGADIERYTGISVT
jgi:hypothetical protein